MDCIWREASRLLALESVHSERTWPPRLVFKNPAFGPEGTLAFTHFYAGSYSSATVETWLSHGATQNELGSVSAAHDFEMGESPSSSLQVIVVPCDGDKRHVLYMDRSIFLELLSILALDEYALYLYLTNVPGLHSLGRRTLHPESRPVLCLYLNAVEYKCIWSYNHQSRAINAILIVEADARWKANQLLQAMLAKDGITFNPLHLAFLACSRGVLTTWECDDEFRPDDDVARLTTMELSLDSSADMANFSEACLWYGKSLANSEWCMRILRTLRDVAEKLDPSHHDPLWNEFRDHSDEKLQQSTSEIQTAMKLVQRQLASRITHFDGHIRWANVNMSVVSCVAAWVR